MKNALFKFCWLAILLLLSACGITGTRPSHMFEFDTIFSTPKTKVVGFSYGNKTQTNRDLFPVSTKKTGLHEWSSLVTRYPNSSLWVKWIDTETGIYYEENVFIEELMPESMDRKRLFFTIFDNKLSIYIADNFISKDPSCKKIVNGKVFNTADEYTDFYLCSQNHYKIFPQIRNNH